MEGAGGQQPLGLAHSSAYLYGLFQDEGWEVRGRRTLHISARAVNSSSCQHGLGFLPGNHPRSSSGTTVQIALGARPPSSSLLRFISRAAGSRGKSAELGALACVTQPVLMEPPTGRTAAGWGSA